MFIRSLKSCTEITAGDGTRLRELLHGPNDRLEFSYSLAHARLGPGQSSVLHRLRVSEVYYILSGSGVMEIDGERREVTAGDAISIPPDATQKIENTGEGDLEFLCIVDPAWNPKIEEILTGA